MNIPVVWAEQKLSDSSVRYVSDSAAAGSQSFTASLEHAAGGPRIIWDNEDGVPLFLIERAERALGINA